ncbi:MAG: hypothetical protein RL154_222 [Pseudomonadota bacterium]|jgi:tRNA(Arg) A34 adenosine deaminase TadA
MKTTRSFRKSYFTLKAITMCVSNMVLGRIKNASIYYKQAHKKEYLNKDPPINIFIT